MAERRRIMPGHISPIRRFRRPQQGPVQGRTMASAATHSGPSFDLDESGDSLFDGVILELAEAFDAEDA